MAKGKKTVFFCQNCGHEESKWLGQCPACKEWNTFVEERVTVPKTGSALSSGTAGGAAPQPVLLTSVDTDDDERIRTGIGELDRVLGGGIVQGSLVLVGGDPGIGKSTLLLQVCQKLSAMGKKILYISGEESLKQIKLRADRMGTFSENLYLLCETNLELIRSSIERQKPDMAVIDSIQTMYNEEVSSAPGSVSQVRESTNVLLQLAKGLNIAIFIVGHVTKEGTVAGPRVLEHMVDTVLYFEGDRHVSYRILRGVKNRFGSTNEIGVFEMRREGLVGSRKSFGIYAERPSGECLRLGGGLRYGRDEADPDGDPGVGYAIVISVCPGERRRDLTITGVNLLMAVLEKRAGLPLSSYDAYVNIAGGYPHE